MQIMSTASAGFSDRQHSTFPVSRSAVQERHVAPLLAQLPRSRRRQLRQLSIKCRVVSDLEQVPQNIVEREAWKEVRGWAPY